VSLSLSAMAGPLRTARGSDGFVTAGRRPGHLSMRQAWAGPPVSAMAGPLRTGGGSVAQEALA
jgi:hypothetical protein